MTEAATRLLEQAEQLPADERAEFADRLLESLNEDIAPEISQAHVAEVRCRIAQVEAGEVTLIPGEEALASVRRLVDSHRVARS